MAVTAARAAAFDILLRVETTAAYAGELLHSGRLDPLSAADRALATELVMGVLRWRSKLDGAIAAASARQLNKLDREVVTALRLAVYQLRFLSRVPPSAAINQSVELVKRARKTSAVPFANAVLRKIAKSAGIPAVPVKDGGGDLRTIAGNAAALPELSANSLAEKYAHPAWVVERWAAAYGLEQAKQICVFDQQVPPSALRLESPEAEQELTQAGVRLEPGRLLRNARTVLSGDIVHTPTFAEGRVSVQDEGSQLVAALVGRGSRILDCCAAPGGKTAALAAQNPTATILATELHAHRAELLRKRVRAANVRVVHADILQLPLSRDFDRVLADVPCSGTGTLARNPEIKWRLRPEDLADLHARQVAILRAALQQLAPGGRVVYSTCSLEREENEAVVEEVLSAAPEFALQDCRLELEMLRNQQELVWSDVDSLLRGPFLRTIPGVHLCDGFFAAVIARTK